MSILYPIIISFFLFFIAYKWYAGKIARLWDVKDSEDVPSRVKYDGLDFVPVKHWIVLFGHHFSSIAGAAPIIGPVIAVSFWGWVPSVLWVLLGSIFIGGVHDFGSLIISVREDGSTIAEISNKVISRKAKLVFSVFLWLTLILIIAVFVHLCAKTFVQKPEVVMPSWGLILIALIVGYLLYRKKLNTVIVTLLGLGLLAGSVILGNFFPLSLSYKPVVIWTVVLLLYSFIASVTPVNILLQPRDYISAFLLIGGMVFGFTGLIISNPSVEMSNGFLNFNNPQAGPLWPILFVTIACGAISGFHSLIASGTTSKQLPNEIDSKKIGYGAMLAEGLLALLALFLVAVAFKNSHNLAIKLKQITPIGVFGEAFGFSTKKLLSGYGSSFAIIILNAFIFTTLDTATRIGRYITQELFGLKNVFLASLIVVVLSAFLALSKQWIKIWPLFGAANQLVAALTFIVLTSWLLAKGKIIRFTLLPAIFMLVTTMGALFYQLIIFIKEGNYLLSVFDLVLMVLAGFIVIEAKNTYFSMREKR